MTTSGMVHDDLGCGQTGRGAEGRGLHVGLWVAQGLLATAFGRGGGDARVAADRGDLEVGAPGRARCRRGWCASSAMMELAGALGLVLPALTRIESRR